uniref:Uncharacterized protein n=1 Tax=Caenorhabditis tropicalis TaxID=1561998 RepID=A0A1I7UE84_9PELO
MQKNNQNKKSDTTGRPAKKDTKNDKKSKNTKTRKRSNTKTKTAQSISLNDQGGGLKTAEEGVVKPAETKKPTPTKKKPQPREKELKLEPTQEDEVKKEEKKDEKKEENQEVQSGMEAVVKDDKKVVKMDDGYEDFGPGAA